MTVNTHIADARTRVRAEREAVEAKVAAFETFRDRVTELPTEPTPSSGAGITATAGRQLTADAPSEDHCRAVRRAFAETVRPHSVADLDDSESLLATIREELSEPVAAALAPTASASFSPELKRMVLSEATTRRTETAVLRRALGREATQLDDAGEVVDDVTGWIANADETPLTELGFDQLRRRHETLADHRDRCGAVATRRQEFLQGTTNRNVEVGIRHRSLVPYLYDDFPVDHPVLATVTRLDAVCAECQRAVRTHLVRRA
jgi:hypothetical protein